MKKILCMFFIFLFLLSTPCAFAQESAGSGKIDQVLKNQEKILQELADIKAELEVVKIRASQR